MCPTLKFSRFWTTAAAVALFVCALQPANAAESLRMGRPSLFSPVTAFPGGVLTIGYFTPAYGEVTLNVSPSGQLSARTLSSDLVSIGRIGVFAGYDERPSVLALSPTTSWNFGASVGYAGFYVRGGVNEAAPIGPLLGTQGLQAGFGYEIGALDLRMTYLTSQHMGLGVGAAEREIDSQQWAIGGIYQITSRIRLNADAFYGVGETKGTPVAVSPLNAPPGTGARVGVELRF